MEYRFGITGCFSLRCQPSPPTTPSPRGTSLSTSSNPPPRRCFPTESKSSSNLDDHLSGILSAEHTEERVYAVLDAVDDGLVVFEFVIGKPLAYHLLKFLLYRVFQIGRSTTSCGCLSLSSTPWRRRSTLRESLTFCSIF